jgi:lipid-A-disaccharide synthase
MKYYVIAGEASGDLHGANLIKALQQLDTAATFRVWGGDKMAATGATLVRHYKDLAFMGFVEVLKNLRTILRNIAFCKQDILDFQPDVLILIDYPGFNLRISKWAKTQQIRNFYYISPQIWAWHSSRVHGIKASVDRMFCILPFEKDFYQKYDYDVDFVGHPLLDVVDTDPQTTLTLGEKPVIALLPGSRRQEIQMMLPQMLSVISAFPDFQFVVAAAPSQSLELYQQILNATAPNAEVKIIANQTYDILRVAKAALVTSGTATLETALFGVPQVVCYKGNTVSYQIARRLVSVKYISLVNLIADRELVKELIQDDLTTQYLQQELQHILDPNITQNIKKEYTHLRQRLGDSGASARTAARMWALLNP